MGREEPIIQGLTEKNFTAKSKGKMMKNLTHHGKRDTITLRFLKFTRWLTDWDQRLVGRSARPRAGDGVSRSRWRSWRPFSSESLRCWCWVASDGEGEGCTKMPPNL